MWARFRRDVNTALFSLPHEFNRACRADVQDMHVSACHLRQQDVAGDDDILRCIRAPFEIQPSRCLAEVHHCTGVEVVLFAVNHDRKIEFRAECQRLAHQFGVHHGNAIIADADCTGGEHAADIREFLPREVFGNAPYRENVRFRVLVCDVVDVLNPCGRICHRRRIRHAGDRGEPAGIRRCCASRNRLFMFKSRFAQVNVHVDEPRRDNHPGCVNALDFCRCCDFAADLRDFSINNEDVANLVNVVRGFDDAAVLNKHFCCS